MAERTSQHLNVDDLLVNIARIDMGGGYQGEPVDVTHEEGGSLQYGRIYLRASADCGLLQEERVSFWPPGSDPRITITNFRTSENFETVVGDRLVGLRSNTPVGIEAHAERHQDAEELSPEELDIALQGVSAAIKSIVAREQEISSSNSQLNLDPDAPGRCQLEL